MLPYNLIVLEKYPFYSLLRTYKNTAVMECFGIFENILTKAESQIQDINLVK